MHEHFKILNWVVGALPRLLDDLGYGALGFALAYGSRPGAPLLRGVVWTCSLAGVPSVLYAVSYFLPSAEPQLSHVWPVLVVVGINWAWRAVLGSIGAFILFRWLRHRGVLVAAQPGA